MNSVNLANKVWKEVRQFSIVPTKELLRKFVDDAADPDDPKFVAAMAFLRIWKRMEEIRAANAAWRKDEKNMELLERLQYLTVTPIQEGSVNADAI
jgi:hypothetical protein